MNKIGNWNLYVITSQELSKGRSILEVVEKAIAGGADVIQLREKSLSGRELVEVGQKIREITLRKKVSFIVNDRIDVAYAVDADGVHLGQNDIPIKYAREILGGEKIVGLSATNLNEAIKAEKLGADYVGAGPVFSTGSKVDASSAFGLETLRKIKAAIRIPVVAIGGINAENASEVIANGADCISVISAVVSAMDIEEAASVLRKIILKSKGGV